MGESSCCRPNSVPKHFTLKLASALPIVPFLLFLGQEEIGAWHILFFQKYQIKLLSIHFLCIKEIRLPFWSGQNKERKTILGEDKCQQGGP